MNICEHLALPARWLPEHEALVFDGNRITYAELDRLCCLAAGCLADRGVQRGDRVALMLPNVPAFAVWYYATLRLGAIPASISARWTAGEARPVLADCQARLLVADAGAKQRVAGQLPDCVTATLEASDDGRLVDGDRLEQYAPCTEWVDCDPDEPAVILYTSGTTGASKGAVLSHRNVRTNVNAFNHLCDQRSSDRILLAVPLFHCFGQNALLNSALNVGATLVLQRTFDLPDSKKQIAAEQVTQLYGVPTMFHLWHESCSQADLQSVRYCFSAAAPLAESLSRRWHEKFHMPIYEGYGLTETSPFASYNHRTKYRMGTIGTPIDGVEMKVVDVETGEPAGPGQLGEIAIRGPNVMLGYWNRPDATAEVIRDGWFHSGDLGQVDDDGFFRILDRLKDMIAVGGLKVYPAEVEDVLLDHDAVADVAVVGLPDEVFGERVTAIVVPRDPEIDPGQLAASLKEHALEHLAPYKTPAEVILAEQLPRNPSGKLLKATLRETYRGSGPASAAAGQADRPPTLPPRLKAQLDETHLSDRRRVAVEYVQGLVETLDPSGGRPTPETRFLESGLDSLTIVAIASQVQAEAGSDADVPTTLVFDHPRVCDLADYLVETLAPGSSAESQGLHSAEKKVPVGNQRLKSDSTKLRDEVEALSEEEAMAELMRELNNQSS